MKEEIYRKKRGAQKGGKEKRFSHKKAQKGGI
jgi:hypothetical protein